MKRSGNIYHTIYSFANLLAATRKAMRGKRHKCEVGEFYLNLEPNLLELSRQLQDKQYHPSPYRRFVIRQPKDRVIHAASFRDRVVHHAICRQLDPYFEKFFITDTYACRTGKGIHKAIDRVAWFCRDYDYFLKCDIRKFFPSVCHSVLKSLLRRKFKDPDLLWVLDQIIDNAPPDFAAGKGIPIGNLTSQYFANLYLDGLDHFIKEKLQIKGYVRYMDDFVLFADCKEKLQTALAEIYEFLLGIELELSQYILSPIVQGVPFCGYHFYRRLTRIQQPTTTQMAPIQTQFSFAARPVCRRGHSRTIFFECDSRISQFSQLWQHQNFARRFF